MGNEYAVGQLVRLSAVFTVSTVAADPTTVIATVRAPDGTITTLTYNTDLALKKDSVGNYHADIIATIGGVWWYRLAGTGVCQAASEGSFFVKSSNV